MMKMFRFPRRKWTVQRERSKHKRVSAFFSTSVLSPLLKLSICRKCSQTPLELISEREKKNKSLSCSDGRKKSEPKTVRDVKDYCKLPSAFFLSPSPPSFSRLTSKLTKHERKTNRKKHCRLVKTPYISKNFPLYWKKALISSCFL